MNELYPFLANSLLTASGGNPAMDTLCPQVPIHWHISFVSQKTNLSQSASCSFFKFLQNRLVTYPFSVRTTISDLALFIFGEHKASYLKFHLE